MKEMEIQTPIISDESLVFVPLGGATGVGLNFFCYGYKGKWLIVDCGLRFADDLPGVDLLLPDPSFIEEHKKDIVGMIITHGHEDHIGAIPYILPKLDCPIYATPFTSELIEEKLDRAGLWGRAQLNTVELGATVELGPFEVEFVNTLHSIPEANMLAIRTKEGLIIHTGDWKFEEHPLNAAPSDMKILEEFGKEGVLAMVGDSIFIEESNETEKDVRASLIDLIPRYKNRIFVTCFASNITRIESIYLGAKAANRKVCLMGRSLWRMESAARVAGYLKEVPDFLTEEEAMECEKNEIVYICTGGQGEPFSALSRLASLQSTKTEFKLEEGDTVIFSSKVIPGNESDIMLIQNKLVAAGAQIVTNQDALVHVSGHPKTEDMKKLYGLLKPQISIPVHGDLIQIAEHKKYALEWGAKSVMVVEEGDIVELNEGNPEILGEVPTGVFAVDGKKVVAIGATVIRQRRKMMEDGTVVATILADKEGYLTAVPQISSFGLIEEKEAKEIYGLVSEKISILNDKHRRDDEFLKELVRLTLRQFIRDRLGKKPVIEVHLFRV